MFRVGKVEGGCDFHFWYRMNTGRWANKHGFDSTGSELLNDMPSDDDSDGWDNGTIDHYHEELKDADGKTYCRGGKLCLKCNPETGRPNWCFMAYGKIDNPDDYNEKALYCPECIEDIL